MFILNIYIYSFFLLVYESWHLYHSMHQDLLKPAFRLLTVDPSTHLSSKNNSYLIFDISLLSNYFAKKTII